MKVVVVGGGISGLAAAHRLTELARERQTPLELTLIEARERLGGTIVSERVDGFLVEAGPDSFLSEKPWALALCRRLGVENRLARTDDRFRKVFVWHGGRLHPLPDGFQLLAPTAMRPFATSSLFTLRGKLRMALDLVLPRGISSTSRGSGDDESLGAFVRRDHYNYYPSANPFADLSPDLETETVSQDRTLTNVGLRSNVSYVKGINNVKVDLYGGDRFDCGATASRLGIPLNYLIDV